MIYDQAYNNIKINLNRRKTYFPNMILPGEAKDTYNLQSIIEEM